MFRRVLDGAATSLLADRDAAARRGLGLARDRLPAHRAGDRRHGAVAGRRGAADWRFVYVAEAHAQDEVALRSARFSADGQPVVVDQPRTLERAWDSRGASKPTTVSSPAYVDNPADEARARAYAPWPSLRLYVVRGATLAWIAEPDGATFEPAVARLRAMFNLESTSPARP